MATSQSTMAARRGNHGVGAARLGADFEIVCCVGRDDHETRAEWALTEEGVGCRGLQRSSQPTGVALVVVDSAGRDQMAVASGANRGLDLGSAQGALGSAAPGDEHEASRLGGPASMLDAGAGAVLVTPGPDGGALHRREYEVRRLASPAVDAVARRLAHGAAAGVDKGRGCKRGHASPETATRA